MPACTVGAPTSALKLGSRCVALQVRHALFDFVDARATCQRTSLPMFEIPKLPRLKLSMPELVLARVATVQLEVPRCAPNPGALIAKGARGTINGISGDHKLRSELPGTAGLRKNCNRP